MNLKDVSGKVVEYIVLAILALGLGYVFGNSEAIQQKQMIAENARRIAELEKINERQEAQLAVKMDGRFKFMGDAADRVNYFCERDEECRRRFVPLRVPQ